MEKVFISLTYVRNKIRGRKRKYSILAQDQYGNYVVQVCCISCKLFLQFLMFLYIWGSDVGWRNDLVSLALFTKTRAFLR